MANVYYAPQKTPSNDCPSVFLAGSIDMGKAVNWQQYLEKELHELDVDIYNPRRDDWDSSWVQSIDNPQFNEQVNWELEHLEKADIIVYFFDPNGQAPITLMELGMYVMCPKTKIAVCSPHGFWRRGNIEVACHRYMIPLFEDIDDLVAWAKTQVRRFHD